MQLLTPLLALSGLIGAFAAPAPAPPTALNAQINQVVPDSYIVVLKPTVSTAQVEEHARWANQIHSRRLRRRDDSTLSGVENTYSTVLKGYAGSFDEETIAAIENSPEVAYVEKDQVAVASALVTQSNSPSWGIPRVSQQKNVDFTKYYYDESAGEGVVAYVVDTGVQINHVDFGGRASWGADFTGSGLSDGNGHGTHVAGTIASATYGIAKKAKIVAVRVLNSGGSGTYAWVIAGIDFTASDAIAKGKANKAVANMSLGGGFSAAVNDAVSAAVDAGITFVVAAGNSDDDAQYYSPASEPKAITVGATDITDERAYYSNYGALVDVFAPGSNITSTWIGSSNTVTRSISGTSMASPHVAGVAAYLIALENLPNPAAVDARIKELAIPGVVINAGSGTTDALIYTGASQLLGGPEYLEDVKLM